MTAETLPQPPTETPDEPVAVTVKLPGQIYARMKEKASNGEHVAQMAGHWLALAALERFTRDDDLALKPGWPDAHFLTDEFVEGFDEAFLSWSALKDGLAFLVATSTHGRKRRLKESEWLAQHHTFRELMDMLKARSTKKKIRKILARCEEVHAQWLCIEAQSGGREITSKGFKRFCDELYNDIHLLV